jgi:hypothetical protein
MLTTLAAWMFAVSSRNMRKQLLRTLIVTALTLPAARAEEGAAGHYTPGAMASFVDGLPSKSGLAVGNYFLYYDGDTGARPIAFGGLLTLDAHAKAYSDSVLAMYRTDLKLLGGNYTPAVIIPYVWMEVTGTVEGPLAARAMRDKADGVGDITVYPFMLGWTKGDLKYDLRLGVYTPSGEYEKGHLANVGKNYWTLEPAGSISWLSSRIGLEVSAFAGLDFNTKNDDTEYQSGDVFHLDLTVAEHLPLGKLGAIGVGANAFYYQQITGDSGSGALLGDFEGRTVGIGPVLSFISKIGKTDVVAELKWLPEIDVDNRLKGDLIWFKLGVAF